MPRIHSLAIGAACLALAGCAGDDQFDATGGVRITRSACPAVAVPAYTGDMTIFTPEQSTDARALDVVANITNVRSTCDVAAGTGITSAVTFDVQARRASASGAREVIVPYFATVIRSGTSVISKQTSRVALRFADGQLRATAQGSAQATIDRASATLPQEIQTQITRRRKPTDPDASIDPMSDPKVRAAVSAASFELLVGFQLTERQLQYNATR